MGSIARAASYVPRLQSGPLNRPIAVSFSNQLSPSEAGRLASEKRNASRVRYDKSMETLLSHAGVDSTLPNAPMSPPLHLASTYRRPEDGVYLPEDVIYNRSDNPTRLLLEKTIGELECHGHDRDDEGPIICCTFASGMAAVTSIVLAHSSPLTVLVPKDLYHGVPTVLVQVMERFDVKIVSVDMTQPDLVLEVLSRVDTPEVVLWMETPSNPRCEVLDVQNLCKVAHGQSSYGGKITTVVDSTMCPTTITQPLTLGVDMVMHSGTKYFGGHSDCLLGVITVSPWTDRGKEMGPILRGVQTQAGGVASAFDSWLVLRGLRTLHVRVERQSANAMVLAKYLNDHTFVAKVYYPGLPTHPGHDIAKRQMKDSLYGGVLSLELKTEAEATAVAGALRVVQRATSLGGTESLIEHRASIEPPERVVSPPGLLRVSVGLESAEGLIEDFAQALQIAEEITRP